MASSGPGTQNSPGRYKMNQQNFQVAVVGGGIGGLALAQGLNKAGIDVAVYERDEAPTSRLQGFRVHIDPQGSTALHDCLPEALWRVFDATGGDFGQGFTVMTERMQELLAFRRSSDAPEDNIARHRSVSRITLRALLLKGIEHIVHFNQRFVRYEQMPDGRFKMHFEGGRTATADLLVGADGVNSAVRKQYLPDAGPVDTGVLACGGKIPLTAGVLALAPACLLDGPAMVVPPAPCSLFMAMWKRSKQAQESLRLLEIEEPIAGDENYLILGFGARPEFLGLYGDPESIAGSLLKGAMLRLVVRWHPNLRKLVEMAEEEEMWATRLRTSVRQEPWKATTVTLLGDAIHSMTPYRGIGANIALKDAALLCAKLIGVRHAGKPILQAVGEYEAAMRDYGFAAVAASRKSMEQAVGEKRNPSFGMIKTAMRVVNGVPSLKRRFIPA